MESQRSEIKSLTDILNLDDAQFGRFLPDLIAWRRATNGYLKILKSNFEEAGMPEAMPEHIGSMIWIDDGEPGKIRSLQISFKAKQDSAE